MIEEIETLSFEYADGRNLRVLYVECEGVISDLRANISRPAIINGTPCVPGRRFSKSSFDRAMKILFYNPTEPKPESERGE